MGGKFRSWDSDPGIKIRWVLKHFHRPFLAPPRAVFAENLFRADEENCKDRITSIEQY
jgi:hypothetical protein